MKQSVSERPVIPKGPSSSSPPTGGTSLAECLPLLPIMACCILSKALSFSSESLSCPASHRAFIKYITKGHFDTNVIRGSWFGRASVSYLTNEMKLTLFSDFNGDLAVNPPITNNPNANLDENDGEQDDAEGCAHKCC